ncbi:MAG: type I methionyl aminopeptidase [Candidatus Omnitrophota bacterium]|nr:type I methionyl aminopeptidase [Candidatus Omnitrophota bacterium]
MIEIKTKEEIEIMKRNGKVLAKISQNIKSSIQPGMTTLEIDHLASDLIQKEEALPAFKGYRGFPANICISVNEEVVHGIPTEKRLNFGDIVSIDIGLKKDGYFADMAFTVALGKVSSSLNKLIDVTRKALDLGIRQAKVNNHLMDISYAIQSYAEAKGFSVVRDFVGHGIGKKMHEDPEVPNFGKPHTGPKLQEGFVLAIEPMVNIGSWEVVVEANGWTARTKDRLASAHFEHTIAITRNGPEILTQ